MLCWMRMCFASASERVNDLSHSAAVWRESRIRYREEHVPGSEHTNGFSPVCERMWEMSANRDVCGIPRRGQVAHSQV